MHRTDPAQDKILLVLKQTGARRRLAQILGDEGFPVLATSSPAEAFPLLHGRREEIGLIIVNGQSGADGLDFAAECGREFPGIDFLFIVGKASSIAGDCLRREAPETVLPAPFTPEMLAERVGFLRSRAPRVLAEI